MASTDHNELALAYRTTDAVEARSLAAELADAGVETHIVGDYRDMAYPGMTVGSMSDKEIWISERDRETAERIVGEWRQTYHPKDFEAPQPMRYSLKTLLVLMTIAVLVCGLLFGSQPVQVFVSVLPYVLFIVFAWKKLRRRRYGGDDEPAAIT